MSQQLPLLCLGSGAALTDGRDWNSLLLDRRILFDLPPTAVPQLHRLGVELSGLQHIFITHAHADHVFGLPFLLLEYCVRRRRSDPLHIIGPAGIRDVTFHLCDLAWPHMRDNGFQPKVPLTFVEVGDEGEYIAGELTFQAVPMQHFDLDAFGYRFCYKGRSIAYTGDTGDCEQLERLLSNVDVAVIELTHPYESTDPGHMNVSSFSRVARRLADQGTRVLATHMSAMPDPIPGVELCEDGKTYWL